MLRDMLIELITAFNLDDSKRKSKAYDNLEKVGVDRITANIMILDLAKELATK